MRGMKKGVSLKILALALVIMLFVSCAGISVWAEDEQPTGGGTTGGDTTGGGTTGGDTATFDVTGSKTVSEKDLEGDERQTEVTLKLPSGEYENEVDIVFTMDSSSSAVSSTVFSQSAKDLFDNIIASNPGVKLKIGVIIFRGQSYDAIDFVSDGAYKGLVEYSDTTKTHIMKALTFIKEKADELDGADGKNFKAWIKANFKSGSNTHGGIDMADEWLDADEDVDDDHKYMVLLTDGKTYIWNDENNVPTTIYSQYYRGNGYTLPDAGKPGLNQSSGYNKYDYSVDVVDPTGKSKIFVPRTYADLYASTNTELTGVSPWDARCYYAEDGSVPAGTVVKHNVTNGAELFGPGSSTYGNRADYQYYFEFTPTGKWVGVPYQEANPFEVKKNEDGTYTFDTTKINPNYYQYHVDCLQKGLYMAGHLWTDVNAKYNCGVITYYGGERSGPLYLTTEFNDWLISNSKYGANIENSTQIQKLFQDIDNSIQYMVSKGTVTDKIAPEFELLNTDESTCFTMTLDGTELPVTFADGKWSFGTANEEGVYPYVVEFDGTDTITWTINVPVENLKPITLSYDLELKEAYAEEGYYDTNASAVLDYKSTDGKKDGTFTFEVPVVHYRELMDIVIIKGWVDEDNKDGRRPDSIVVNLYADGELTGKSVKITSESPEIPLDPQPLDPVPLDEPGYRAAKGPEQEPEDEPDEEPDVSEVWVGLIQGVYRYVYDGFDITKRDEKPVEIEYSIQEDKIPYYEAEYEGEAPFLVIVNTYVPPTPQPDTGYVSYRMLLIALQYLCIVLCAYAVVKQKRRLNRK